MGSNPTLFATIMKTKRVFKRIAEIGVPIATGLLAGTAVAFPDISVRAAADKLGQDHNDLVRLVEDLVDYQREANEVLDEKLNAIIEELEI